MEPTLERACERDDGTGDFTCTMQAENTYRENYWVLGLPEDMQTVGAAFNVHADGMYSTYIVGELLDPPGNYFGPSSGKVCRREDGAILVQLAHAYSEDNFNALVDAMGDDEPP